MIHDGWIEQHTKLVSAILGYQKLTKKGQDTMKQEERKQRHYNPHIHGAVSCQPPSYCIKVGRKTGIHSTTHNFYWEKMQPEKLPGVWTITKKARKLDCFFSPVPHTCRAPHSVVKSPIELQRSPNRTRNRTIGGVKERSPVACNCASCFSNSPKAMFTHS